MQALRETGLEEPARRAIDEGKPFLGDATKLVLTSHEEIAIAFGTPPAKVPTHFSFPSGY